MVGSLRLPAGGRGKFAVIDYVRRGKPCRLLLIPPLGARASSLLRAGEPCSTLGSRLPWRCCCSRLTACCSRPPRSERRWPTRPASRCRRWRRPAARSSRWAGCVHGVTATRARTVSAAAVVEIMAVERVVVERFAVEVVEAGEGGCGGCGGGVEWWSGGPPGSMPSPRPATPLLSCGSPGTSGLPAPLTAVHARVLAGRQAHR